MRPGVFARCPEKEPLVLDVFDICPGCERLDDGDLRAFAFGELVFEPPIRVARDLPANRLLEDPP